MRSAFGVDHGEIWKAAGSSTAGTLADKAKQYGRTVSTEPSVKQGIEVGAVSGGLYGAGKGATQVAMNRKALHEVSRIGGPSKRAVRAVMRTHVTRKAGRGAVVGAAALGTGVAAGKRRRRSS